MSAKVGALVSGVGVAIAMLSVPAQAATPAASDAFVLGSDGTTAPVYSYADAVHESVWVDAPDLDGDGVPEKVAVDIIRPHELDGVAKVPVIMDASPYYSCCGRGNENELKTYDPNGTIAKMPLFYDNYFVPRGYAVAQVDMAGTSRSTGCVDEGGPSDILSVKAAIDWLNGRTTAHDINGNPVTADWTNGVTAMIGKSYDGTLANGVAATGVDGLKTIVDISGISSWYDYDRGQGLPFSTHYPTFLSTFVEQNRWAVTAKDCSAVNAELSADDADATGAHTAFWDVRDYRQGSMFDASKVKADVFISHGLQDTNVDTPNFSRWWAILQKQPITTKMWLSRMGHVDPFDYDRAGWVDVLHRWFDHELLGIDNGVNKQPRVHEEVAPNTWVDGNDWPNGHDTKLQLGSDGTMTLGKSANGGDASFVNAPRQTFTQALAAGDNPNRLLFATGTLKNDVEIAGQAVVTTTVTDSAPTGQITVGLVDYGTADRVAASNDGVRTLTTQSCWGESTAVDDACYFDVQRNIQSSAFQILARGWARLDGAGTHTLSVSMQANDLTIPAGHQIGLVIMGVDRGQTVTVDNAATPYTVNVGATELDLKVAGSMESFAPGQLNLPRSSDVGDADTPADVQIP